MTICLPLVNLQNFVMMISKFHHFQLESEVMNIYIIVMDKLLYKCLNQKKEMMMN